METGILHKDLLDIFLEIGIIGSVSVYYTFGWLTNFFQQHDGLMNLSVSYSEGSQFRPQPRDKLA